MFKMNLLLCSETWNNQWSGTTFRSSIQTFQQGYRIIKQKQGKLLTQEDSFLCPSHFLVQRLISEVSLRTIALAKICQVHSFLHVSDSFHQVSHAFHQHPIHTKVRLYACGQKQSFNLSAATIMYFWIRIFKRTKIQVTIFLTHFLNSVIWVCFHSVSLRMQHKQVTFRLKTRHSVLTEMFNQFGVLFWFFFFFLFSFKYHSGYLKLYLISASCLDMPYETYM